MRIFGIVPLSSIFAHYEILLSIVIIILCGLRWWNEIRDYVEQEIKFIKLAKTLPGPTALPLVGNALSLWESDKIVLNLTKMGREINAPLYRLWVGPMFKIVTTDPKDYEVILKSANSSDKDDIYLLIRPAAINALFIMPYGPLYRDHRKVLTSPINGAPMLNVYLDNFNEKSRIFVQCLKKEVGVGEFDVHDYVQLCLVDIVFETIFGIPGNAQQGKIPEILHIVEELLHITHHRMASPWLYPDIIFKSTRAGRRWKKAVDWGHNFINEIIESKRNVVQSPDYVKTSVFDFLVDHMLKSNDFTEEDIRSEMTMLFIASHDTLLGICNFAILMIAMHPEVQENIKKEIKNVVAHEDLRDDDLKDLKYLDMVIRETVRLFPVGPLFGRKTTGDLKLNTCTLPKDCSIILLPHATHRDPKHWVEPEKFMPERFTPENSKNRHPMAYVPFSFGIRMCPGPKYAMNCLKVMIVHLIRSYELTTTMKLEKLRLHTHISTRCLDGYRISLKNCN